MPKADWGSGASGAASGGIAGFSAGGPIGGIVGAVTGGLTGLFGGKKKKKKRSTLDKKQQQLNDMQHDSILGKGPLADLYNYDPEKANAVFDQNFANPAYRQFKEKLAPEITGQFRSNGLQNSSYAGDAISRLARDIQENLNAKRTEYLYKQENNAKSAKQNAVENLQNRQTFAFDKQGGGSGNQYGGTVDDILSQITPQNIESLKDTAIKYLPGGV